VVFPGLGQVILRHYKRGAVIMFTVLVSLSVVIVIAVQHALAILETIGSKGDAITMSTIWKAATQASTASESLILKLLLLLIIFCWIIGTVDAYRIGKKKDIEALK
jgi:hypothetical protein